MFFAGQQQVASEIRGVAQPGSALAWGARGREFESRRPDQYLKGLQLNAVSPFLISARKWNWALIKHALVDFKEPPVSHIGNQP